MATVPTAEHFPAYTKDFEGSPAGPTLTNAAVTTAVSSAQAHSGTKSYALTATGTTNDSYVAIGGDFATVLASGLNLSPQKMYRFTGWRYVPSGVTVANAQAPARAYLDNGASTALRGFSGRWVGGSAPAADTWGQYEIVFYTSTNTTANQRISLRIYHGGTSGTVYWDDLALVDFAVESQRYYLWYITNAGLNAAYGGTNVWHTIDYITSSEAEPVTGNALTTVNFGTDTTLRTLTVRPVFAGSTTNPTTGDGWVLMREYMWTQPPTYFRAIPAGVWSFQLVLRATTLQLANDTTLSARVYRVSSANVRTLLFTATDSAFACGVGYVQRTWSSSSQPRYTLAQDEAIEIVWMINSRGVAVTGQTFHFPMDQEALALGGNATPYVDVPSPGLRTDVVGTLTGAATGVAGRTINSSLVRKGTALAVATLGPRVLGIFRSAAATALAQVKRGVVPAVKTATVTAAAATKKAVEPAPKTGTSTGVAVHRSKTVLKFMAASSTPLALAKKVLARSLVATGSGSATLGRAVTLARQHAASSASSASAYLQIPQSVLNRMSGAVVKKIIAIFDE